MRRAVFRVRRARLRNAGPSTPLRFGRDDKCVIGLAKAELFESDYPTQANIRLEWATVRYRPEWATKNPDFPAFENCWG